jgi:UPF0716 protein FxsA
MGLLIVLYPFAEIFAFYQFIQAYSFWDALILVIFSGLLGSLIIRLQGQATLGMLQKDLSQGKIPTGQILHRSLVILGGFLLFLPGILSDILGVLCILPGSRHLIAWYLKSLIARGVFRGRVFMSGFGSTFGAGFRRGRPSFEPEDIRVERDAQVIDVEPVEVTHSKKEH